MVVNVIGAGLAGCEASYYLACHGIKVNLYEMKPVKRTPASKSDLFAELVCSNSLRGASIENAVGLLKEEMRRLGSIVMESALNNSVEAGGALAVDRELFSKYITDKIKSHPNIKIINEEVIKIPSGPTIIATGPLTSDEFSKAIAEFVGKDYLYFFDAVAPIVTSESINKDIAYLKSRYDKGEPSYYNCPMTEEQFDKFYNELILAERVKSKDFEMKVFEGCMAIEDMADRGRRTLLFGPMKPIGLRYPGSMKTPYAVVQLRQDNTSKTLYNIVGFQTHLKWGEQDRVFRLIPGLENAEFVRYGVMHRNTYINSYDVINKYYQSVQRNDLFFAGQITGVEGYVESASSGLICAINMKRFLEGKDLIDFTMQTASGSLPNYISSYHDDFVPMNVNYSIFEPLVLEKRVKKGDRKKMYSDRALEKLDEIMRKLND
ncbi:MAG: methylenetetrahydrofolate--tRNA-(uracil(54)-C(5))-methyltransferase (FADH(2)-oxidizing) TrmFO [Coprobacillus sp.]|nr:methylenetetrahydrofolate--tRNA-(uracil(54)-C(5))-methyltransferase (FADH(2)-oxidizing) TrmFO [Coprobacillus sp.]MDY4145403.1 methylenetetrahydrofolate--tRNA-(uracil(54)-C(5))-methyltransferase (FADH(2)-oxidizing) TrmFO [Bacilli bacterium]